MASNALNGLKVLVTRASKQSAPLCHLIEQAGGHPIHWAMIEISPELNHPDIKRAKASLAHYTDILFISANAVHYGLQALQALPNTARISAVGKQTARALAEQGYSNINAPNCDFSSQGLLNTPALSDMENQSVLIVRATKGKETLKNTLIERGATVDYMACYRVEAPMYFPPQRHALSELFHQQKIDVITANSAVSLTHLAHMAPSQALFNTPVLPISTAMSDKAKLLGFKSVLSPAQNASDEAILDAICDFACDCACSRAIRPETLG